MHVEVSPLTQTEKEIADYIIGSMSQTKTKRANNNKNYVFCMLVTGRSLSDHTDKIKKQTSQIGSAYDYL